MKINRVTMILYLKSGSPQLVTDLNEMRCSVPLPNIADLPENQCSAIYVILYLEI